jgi:hypothetical protein
LTAKYLLDTDILIRAKNDHYGMDFCPAFWDWLVTASTAGQVCSIRAVLDELIQKAADPDDEDVEEEDNLSKWVKSDGKSLFMPHDQQMAEKMRAVATWASSQRYTEGAVNTFLSCADYHIVTYALAHGCTVVSHEKPSNSVKKLKIPDACRGLNIRCARPFDMLRALGATFVLKPKS